MRLCAIVPSYRHFTALPALSEALRDRLHSVLIIDDGNEGAAQSAIAALHAPVCGVEVIRLEINSGKGAAMLAGFRAAIDRDYTHALQIDADGQHDIADVDKFIDAAHHAPDSLICGQALYDASVPKSRKFGRYITHFCVWAETCSLDIADSMCGFRLYPLAAVAQVIRHTNIGARMDFDTEMAVHLHWRGVRFINIPTRVIYPVGNVSNFAMWADNVRITLMHTRLVLQAPFRLIWKYFLRR